MRKGNQWRLGMKAHGGVDSKIRLIRSIVVTAANVHDSSVLEGLLRGDDTRVWGDAVYTGQTEAIRKVAPCAQGFTHENGRRNQLLDDAARTRIRNKLKVRAKVENVVSVIKWVSGFSRERYRGLARNTHIMFVLCTLTYLYMVRRRLCQVT